MSPEDRDGTSGVCAWYSGNDGGLHIAMTEEVNSHVISTVCLCILREEKNQK